MPAANLLHSFEGLMGSLVTLDHRAQFASDVANSDRVRIALRHHHAIHHVALREDAKQPAAFVDYADCANVSLGHELSRFLHRRRFPGGVRLTVPNDVSDKHRACLLFGFWGTGIIKNDDAAVSSFRTTKAAQSDGGRSSRREFGAR